MSKSKGRNSFPAEEVICCQLRVSLGKLPKTSGGGGPDVEIVGQPVSEADRKFLTVQKVWRDSSFP